jgi:hypothetical protein
VDVTKLMVVLQALFGTSGEVIDCRIEEPPDALPSGLVTFRAARDAAQALLAVGGAGIEGETLSVVPAEPPAGVAAAARVAGRRLIVVDGGSVGCYDPDGAAAGAPPRFAPAQVLTRIFDLSDVM